MRYKQNIVKCLKKFNFFKKSFCCDWHVLIWWLIRERMYVLPGVFSLEASDVSVERRASDLNFFSGTCSVVWWAGVLYFLSVERHTKQVRGLKQKTTGSHSLGTDLLSTVACECTWWLLTGWEGLSISSDPRKSKTDFQVNSLKSAQSHNMISLLNAPRLALIFPIRYFSKD